MDRYIRYTIKSAYGENRAYVVDDKREAIELLTGAKTLTQRAARGLKNLGLELEYAGDVSYQNDPIYPHGNHSRPKLMVSTFYLTRDQAERIAAELGSAADDEWAYEVVEAGRYFKVRITDEDGEFIAFFGSLI